MTHTRNEHGVTLIEVLVVVAILGISLGVTALNLKSLETPIEAGVTLTESLFREARLSAIATTSAHRVQPGTSSRLDVQRGPSCSGGTWTPLGDMELDLPPGVTMSDTGWSVCFSSRGISADNVVITLQHDLYASARLEVLLGGTTRVLQ